MLMVLLLLMLMLMLMLMLTLMLMLIQMLMLMHMWVITVIHLSKSLKMRSPGSTMSFKSSMSNSRKFIVSYTAVDT